MSPLFKTTFQCSTVEQEGPVLHKIRFDLVVQFALTNRTGVAKGDAVSGCALALRYEVTAGGVITFQPRDRSDRTHRQLQTKTADQDLGLYQSMFADTHTVLFSKPMATPPVTETSHTCPIQDVSRR